LEVLFQLAWRAIATALAIVLVARVGERSGALMASVVMTFPMNAGPGFLFMAMDQSAGFIRDAALAGLAGTGAVLAFVTCYVRAAPYGSLAVRLGAALLGWLALALLVVWLPRSQLSAFGLIALGTLIVWGFLPPVTTVLVTAARAPWSYLLARAVFAGLVIASVAALASTLGATLAGLAYACPITVIASIWVLHRRYGAAFALTAVAGVPGALAAYAGFVLVLYLASGPSPPLLAWALAVAAAIVIAGARALIVRQRSAATRA
jgi:hypothetical protein